MFDIWSSIKKHPSAFILRSPCAPHVLYQHWVGRTGWRLTTEVFYTSKGKAGPREGCEVEMCPVSETMFSRRVCWIRCLPYGGKCGLWRPSAFLDAVPKTVASTMQWRMVSRCLELSKLAMADNHLKQVADDSKQSLIHKHYLNQDERSITIIKHQLTPWYII